VLAGSWVHFVAFECTVNGTFGQVANARVQSAPSVASPQQPANAQPLSRLTDSIKHAKSTKGNVSRNVRGVIVAYFSPAPFGQKMCRPLGDSARCVLCSRA
jgi:hypothetical protein